VELKQFKDAIEDDYFFEMLIDDLPVWGYVGEVVHEEFLLGRSIQPQRTHDVCVGGRHGFSSVLCAAAALRVTCDDEGGPAMQGHARFFLFCSLPTETPHQRSHKRRSFCGARKYV
jgi:hypothetical protein